MRIVQLFAHLCELACILFGAFGLFSAGARVGAFALQPLELYACLLSVGHQVAGLRCRYADGVHFLRQLQLFDGGFGVAEIEFEHQVRILLVVITCTVGAFAGADIVVEVNGLWCHDGVFVYFCMKGSAAA